MSESASDAKRTWTRGQWKATALMYPSYAAAIFGRTAIDAALPAMILDPANGFTAADTATLLSTGVMFYSIGKLFGGAAADKFGGSATFSLTMLNSALQTFLISTSGNINAMSIFWGLARLGGGSFWPAMNKVAASWWDDEQFGQAWSILTTSSRMGAIIGGLSAGVLLKISNWRMLLRCAAVSNLLTGGAMALFLKAGPVVQKAPEDKQEGSYIGNLLKICITPRVLLTYGTQGMMLPLNELNSLIPLFLVQNASVSTATASSLATAYPVGAILSMLLSGKIFDRACLRVSLLFCLSEIPFQRLSIHSCSTGDVRIALIPIVCTSKRGHAYVLLHTMCVTSALAGISDSARIKLFGAQNVMAVVGLQVLSMRPSSVPVIVTSLVAIMAGV